MAKNSPPKIDDTWYFRGQLMQKLPLLKDGEYIWHKVQNCKKCSAKKLQRNVYGDIQLKKHMSLENGQLWVVVCNQLRVVGRAQNVNGNIIILKIFLDICL